MGLDSRELSLDLNCGFSPKSFSDLLAEVSLMDDIPMRLFRLNDYVDVLEQEMRKVDAFKRELPFCMILLNDAILKLKEEVLQLKNRNVEGSVAVEKFMSLKVSNSDENRGTKVLAECADSENWMSSAQHWTTPIQYENSFNHTAIFPDSISLGKPICFGDDGMMRISPFEARNFSNKGKLGTISIKKRNCGAVKIEGEEEEAEDLQADGLSLSIPVAEMTSKPSTGDTVANPDCNISEGSSSQQQSKKQRRCWSPELHQSFVNALLELGGAQAATPKQIREVMKVEGLTNDEVKSHLQKYRLHIRKLQLNSSGAMPEELERWLRRGNDGHVMQMPSVVQSGSPDGPLNTGGSAAKGVSVTVEEEEEDLKSESRSWKGGLPKPSSV